MDAFLDWMFTDSISPAHVLAFIGGWILYRELRQANRQQERNRQ